MLSRSLLDLRTLEGPSLFRTPLIKAERLGEYLGVRDLYVKYEGVNPTGTQKDRAAALHAARARSEGYNAITVGTCGNYGAALAYYARIYGLKAVIFVPRYYTNARLKEMEANGAEIVMVDGPYEDAVMASENAAREYGWYDANPGSKTGEVSLEAYKGIAYEIVGDLGKEPDTVIVPLGNGTTLTSIYLGFKDLLDMGLIDRLPRMIAATTIHGNPVAIAYRMGLEESPVLREVVETPVNEPLVSLIAFDGDKALRAIRETGGFVVEVADHKMIRYAHLSGALEGICVLPASASTLEAVARLGGLDGGSVHVAVYTGRCP